MVASCQGTPTLPIALPEKGEDDLTLLLGYEGHHLEGAYAFDLRSTYAPDFDFEVDEDGTIYAGFAPQALENLRLSQGELVLGDANERPPFSGARFLENRIQEERYAGWSPLEAQPQIFSRIPIPPEPKICRYVEVTETIEVGVIGFGGLALVDADTVLVSGGSTKTGGLFEVTRAGATRVPDLDGAPSGQVWRDDRDAFWSVDDSGRLARIHRTAGAYAWTEIETASIAIAAPMQVTTGYDGDEAEVAILTVTGELLFRRVSEPAWRYMKVPINPDEHPVNLDVEWYEPSTLLLANGFPAPRRLHFGPNGVDETEIRVVGPEVDDFLVTFGFSRSDAGLHMITSGLVFTHFMVFDDAVDEMRFRPDRPSIIPRLPGVAIDALGDGMLLYRTKGPLIGVDDNNGCVEPRELPVHGLRFPTLIDADHGVIIDQGDNVDLPLRVLFLEFLDGPSRLDP